MMLSWTILFLTLYSLYLNEGYRSTPPGLWGIILAGLWGIIPPWTRAWVVRV